MKLDEYKKLLSRFNMNVAFSEPDLKTIFEKNLIAGYRLDLGYHAIGGGVLSNVNSVLSELGDNVDFLESYVGLIKEEGYDFPFLSRIDKLKILPNIFRLLFASENRLKQLDKISMSETIKQYGKGKMKLILEVFSRSITTINNLDKISSGEMLRAQRNLYKGSKPVGYPIEGLGSITDKFASYIKKNGGEIYLNKTVRKINIKNNKASSIEVDGKNHSFDIIISNILIQNLFKILDKKYFPSQYEKQIKSLPGTASLCGYYSLNNLDRNLIGKTFHFIERNVGLEGNDVVGMIDFMAANPKANLSPIKKYLVQSYVICNPNEAKDKKTLKKLKEMLDKNLRIILPNFKTNLNWAIYPAIWHLDGVAKTINNEKPSIKTPIENLFLVGDCVKAPGIGFNCALNSARILADTINSK